MKIIFQRYEVMSWTACLIFLAGSFLTSCSSSKKIITIPVQHQEDYQIDDMMPEPVFVMPVPAQGKVMGSEPRNVVAKATAFRMSGDYADKVAVTLGTNGELTYFPAPSDISAASAPVALGNGWYLNRQGLSANSVFTKWTFAEYAALSKVPSPAEIKAAIIPGAEVTEFVTLPVSAGEAAEMTPAELLKLL